MAHLRFSILAFSTNSPFLAFLMNFWPFKTKTQLASLAMLNETFSVIFKLCIMCVFCTPPRKKLVFDKVLTKKTFQLRFSATTQKGTAHALVTTHNSYMSIFPISICKQALDFDSQVILLFRSPFLTMRFSLKIEYFT